MNIERPIFIISTGRAGSTVFGRTLALHPQTTFLTGLNSRFPDQPWLNRLAMHGLANPATSALMASRLQASEAYPFWEYYAPGFRRPSRDLTSDDVTEHTRRAIRSAVSRNLTPQRPRFLAKFTGWPRLGYLKEVFPDAHFVHLVRDGRDVANSFLRVKFWDGWTGPENWRLGLLPPPLQSEWEGAGRSYVALAGLSWKILVNAVHETRSAIASERFHEFRYEDFIQDPVGMMRDVTRACEMEPSPRFLAKVSRVALHDRSGAYLRDLTGAQQRLLERMLATELERYGYH